MRARASLSLNPPGQRSLSARNLAWVSSSVVTCSTLHTVILYIQVTCSTLHTRGIVSNGDEDILGEVLAVRLTAA